MLASLRRKVGMIIGPSAPAKSLPPPSITNAMVVPQACTDPVAGQQQPFTMQELGFAWMGDRNVFNPGVIPVWLQEQVCLDRFYMEVTFC